MRKAAMYMLTAAVLVSGWSGLGTARIAQASIDLMSNHQLVVLAETKLLDDYKQPESVAGSLAGMQMLRVACIPPEHDCLAEAGGKEYIRVKTWMGDKWIEDTDSITAGEYLETERDITLVEEMQMYDRPNVGIYSKTQPSKERIGPQKVRATAMYRYLYKGARTARAMLEAPVWYRISTEQYGEKWVVDPFIPEDRLKDERPTDRGIMLTGNELLYDYPYEAAGQGAKAKPGVVQAVASSLFNIKTQIYVWYKIELEDGTFKWVKTHPLAESERGPVMETDLAHETIKLRTATRYFDIGGEASLTLQDWVQPGSYIADKINNGWARIQTPAGWKVVNLDRAPLERPSGITNAQETVMLTPATKTYYFPLTGEVCHQAGTFGNQEAVSFEKWVSPQGVIWYHISTYSGIVWVPEQPLPE